MNIFKVIERATSKIEPIHSRYLADCLVVNKEFLQAFWSKAVSGDLEHWPYPGEPIVSAEEVLEGGKRIDISIRDDIAQHVMGIEVKTTDSSVKSGQLDDYLVRLKGKYPLYGIWIVYLTPFTAANAPPKPYGKKAAAEFRCFSQQNPSSSHLSWADISSLEWNEVDDVWRQHQQYVRDHICAPPPPSVPWGSLEQDFGWETMRDFWSAIEEAGIEAIDGEIILKPSDNADAIAGALKLLLTHESIRSAAKGTDNFPKELRAKFLDSPFENIHRRLFELPEEFGFIRISGRRNFGIRVPHSGEHALVSICTSKGVERLRIGRPAR